MKLSSTNADNPLSLWPESLPHGLAAWLHELRMMRGFSVETWVSTKARKIAEYLDHSGITDIIVGVSGGIDSAVTVALLKKAGQHMKQKPATVRGVLLPIDSPGAATRQREATLLGRLVLESLDLSALEIPLGDIHLELAQKIEASSGLNGTPWARGQLVSTLRTPVLYYLTSLITEAGGRALVCGTTNRDEGSYIGFFGKASDGMNDLQPLSDLHKSEVRQVARHLGIPQPVLEAAPTGDTFDGRTDEKMMEVNYDFLELWLLARCAEANSPLAALNRTPTLSDTDRTLYLRGQAAIERMHAHNHHKYLGSSPAIHWDVMERAVPGGWRANPSGHAIQEPRSSPTHAPSARTL